MIEPGWLGLNRRILVAVKRACWGFFAIGPVYAIILGNEKDQFHNEYPSSRVLYKDSKS